MFKIDKDHLQNTMSAEYENCIVQDQALFKGLLSTISQVVLPHFISYKGSYEVWDKVQKNFTTMMKARMSQFHIELKTTKKLNHFT